MKGKWRQANWAGYLKVGKFCCFLHNEQFVTVYRKLQNPFILTAGLKSVLLERGNERKSTKFAIVLSDFSNL